MKTYTLDEIKKEIKKIETTDENVYDSYLVKEDKGKAVHLGFYIFCSTGFSAAGRFLVYLQMDYTGKIIGIRLGDRNPEEYKVLIGSKLDLNTLEKYKTEVHDQHKSLNCTSVLGEVEETGVIRMYTKRDYLNPKTIKYEEVNDKPREVKNQEYVDYYKAFTKKYKKHVKYCSQESEHGDKWRVNFDLGAVSFSIELWLFLGYNFEVTVWRGEGRGISLSPKILDPSKFMDIVEEIIYGKLSNITKSIIVTNNSRYNQRGYTFKEKNNAVEATIRFDGDKEPRGKYTFNLDFKKKKVTCLDNKRSTTFIPRELERYQERIKEIDSF